MNNKEWIVREATSDEFKEVGQLMVNVYTQLEGFFSEKEHPEYYKKLVNVGELTTDPPTKLLIAISRENKIGGGVVYLGDMKYYGALETVSQEKNAAGFRLLAVDPILQGNGIGKLLTNRCIQLAKEQGRKQVIIHSTNAMKVAWNMYEKMGFIRSKDLDFSKNDFPVFGFKLIL